MIYMGNRARSLERIKREADAEGAAITTVHETEQPINK